MLWWSKRQGAVDRFPASPPQTGRAPLSASGFPFKRGSWPIQFRHSAKM